MGGSTEKLKSRRKRPRRCVGCGKENAKGDLIRVVRSPEGIVSVDAPKAAGRGAYLCGNVECVKQARKKNALSRALKQPIDPEVYEQLEAYCIDRAKSGE